METLSLLAAVGLLVAPGARVEVRAREPGAAAAGVFRGVPLASLLPALPGDSVLVRCADGFVVLLPLALVREAGPVVAEERLGAHGFETIPAPRGPRYLVWPERASGSWTDDPDVTSEGWAWAVDELSIVDAGRYLAPLTPVAPSPRVERGRAIWLRSCFHCHAVSGAGGMAGWDLAYPTPVWRYLDPRRIARAIVDPRAENPGGHMPPQKLSPEEVRAVLDFLRAAVRP